MRGIYAAFFITCLGAAVFLSMAAWVSVRPDKAAADLLESLKRGSATETAALFGDNSCRCPPAGGYISWLKYETGQEPNMGFLLGRRFDAGAARVTWLKDRTPYLIPWEAPESTYVDIPLRFRADAYRPLFLPLPLAYGRSMQEEEFERALADLHKDEWKGFSLRLRAGIQPGLIPPAEALPAKQGEAQNKSAADSDRQLAAELLGKQAAMYLVPRDAGAVIQADGSKLPQAELEARLPRLESVTLRLNVVRRGPFKPWRVARFEYMDAVVQTPGYAPVMLLNPARQASSGSTGGDL